MSEKAPNPAARKCISVVAGKVAGPQRFMSSSSSAAKEPHSSIPFTLQANIQNRSPVVEAHSCDGGFEKNGALLDSPPPAPLATKRRRYMAFMDQRHSEGLVKKLSHDFDCVATENEIAALSHAGNLTGHDDDDAIKVAEDMKSSKLEPRKAKAGGKKRKILQGNNNTVSGNNVITTTCTILAKRHSN